MLFFSGEPGHYSFTFASTRPALFSPKDRDIQGAYDYIPQKLRTTFSSRRQFILHNFVNRLRLSLGIGEHARFDDAGSRTRCVISNHPLSKVLGPRVAIAHITHSASLNVIVSTYLIQMLEWISNNETKRDRSSTKQNIESQHHPTGNPPSGINDPAPLVGIQLI